MRLFFILLLSALLIPTVSHTQTESEEEGDSRIYELADRTYIYQNQGGNVGLYIGRQGTLVIDTQSADVTEDLLKVIGRFSDKPIKYVVNTNHQIDNTGGNGNLSREGALIIAHDNVPAKLIEDLNSGDEKGDTEVMPNITVANQLTFYFNKEEISVHHLKDAHSDGDLVVHFKDSNILHSGDAFVNKRYPFVDVDNGGSYDGYIEGLTKIAKFCDNDTKIIPGHGEVARQLDVKKLKQLMEFVHKRVAFHHLNKKSEEEILAMTNITETYDQQGYGDHQVTRKQFMKMIYDDVKSKYSFTDRDATANRIEEIRKEQESKRQNQGDKGGR